MKFKTLIFLTIITITACSMLKDKTSEITVDASQIIHTMKGGMGASWHALQNEIPLENGKYKYPVREIGSRGSAYGGNPPVNDTTAWLQIKNHAAWLGLNFIRVEIDQRMYEPERKQFDWENEEMQALYQILDFAETSGADVFLQQMWGHVEWNSYPGVHPLISAPKNLDDFADGIATLLEYLTITKGYNCIKFFCMTNEPPGGPWGYWWDYGDETGSINDAWERLKTEFDMRGISIPISGPDWTSMPPFEEEKLTFAPHLGAFDIHSYDGVTAEREATLKKWADWAHAQNKPFFLTEYGNMQLGWGTDNPAQKSFEAALSNANDVMRALRAGVDGLNRWSFTNRGDLDGQWQLIHTFDRENKTYLKEIKPENEAYFGFGIISRFLSKYSSTISCKTNEPDSVLMSVALLSPTGELSVFILNKSDEEQTLSLKIDHLSGKEMNVYQTTKEAVANTNFGLNSIQSFNSTKTEKILLPAKSITTVSSYALKNSDNGIILQ
ncbi:MAG: cellulase family glycosylhydrolase [Draconibacterium sp.]|nr:cellulase family glycosylhydrolase [Draconibacterium sp.]